MTVFIVRILFLLLPGAIASSIYWKLKGRSTQKDWEDFFEIIIFSLISYLIYALITFVLGLFNVWWVGIGLRAKEFSYFQPVFDEKLTLDLAEVFYTCLIAIPLGVIASYLNTYKTINKIGQKIGATTRFGDEDVWDFINRSPDFKGQWVTIRDHKLKLNYACWIEAFSDSGKERELLLREVNVYSDETCELLYNVDILYLSRKADEISLEANLPDRNNSDETESKEHSSENENEKDGDQNEK